MDVTDSELEMEGLTKIQYDALDGHSKDFINERVKTYRMFKDAKVAADFIVEIAKEEGQYKAQAILLGHDLEGVERIKKLIRKFKHSGQTDVKNFYLTTSNQEVTMDGISINEPTESDKSNQPQQTTQPQKEDEGKKVNITAPNPSDDFILTPSKTDKILEKSDNVGETHDLIPQNPVLKTGKPVNRELEIAKELARWQNTDVEKIQKTESDIIQKIIEISDENRLTDIQVLKSCESMIRDEFHEAQFHMEALALDHRNELIKRALTFK